jgi:hypothetical protein
LLAEGRWIAKRDGTLIAISKASDAAAAAPEPVPVARPEPAGSAARGEDRIVTGGSARVERGETVKDLVVLGGSAEVLGTVTGDLAVMGGRAVVRKDGRVEGDATVLGGSLQIEDGGAVEGDIGIVGGRLERGEGARIGGSVQQGKGRVSISPSGTAGRIGSAITRMALLFVFGTVLLALATRRMEALQGEVVGRPMRAFALGVVGSIVAIFSTVALVVSIVGIPIAIIALLIAVFGAYAGICAVLATVGGALVQHRTQNPYVHLAVGCLVFMLAGAIPYIGGVVTAAVVLIAIGALVSTRGAGFFLQRRVRDQGPYRTPAV